MTKSDGELVASLSQQLAEQLQIVPPELKRFHEKKQLKTRAVTNEDRLLVFKSLVTHFSRVYIFIDALDECSKDNRDKFLWYLKRMQGFMHIFITSRPHVDLDSCFIHMSKLEIVSRDSDIKEYLLSEIDRDTGLAKLIARDPRLKEEIIDSICTKAKGM
ncbi:hypothetical protein BO78DRAFT_21576 [Aspergillus sclerotiicarbonarius CBS 121057]|uniref:Nephrocystin 3-like N-terminal domain-containing protein n=1 Tax=Aspergillus sclerotiicarbonarius (strain CBS 121057 / IBT 28362) TaxID=1448318 RepID=A0A319DUW2_ASPSB|nr:hypothetical protein BO78DRAFT_21576 [Aspergillus sclerotiicarbonarius CBS 121057]